MAGKGFVFLESYYEAAKDLPDKQRLALYDAIIKYALKNEEAKLAGITKSLFVLIQPVIDKSAKRAKAGSKGGASKKDICLPEIEQKNSKQTASKTQAKFENSLSKTEANVKQSTSDYIKDHYPTDNEDLSPTEIVDKDPATQEDDDFATQKEKDYDPPPKSPQGDLLRGGARNSSQEVEIELLLNTGEMYPVSREKADRWRELYPAVDVSQELRNMAAWLESNPTKCKTKSGILRFCNGWLAREQDKGRRFPPPAQREESPDPSPTPEYIPPTPEMDEHRVLIDPDKPFNLDDYLP